MRQDPACQQDLLTSSSYHSTVVLDPRSFGQVASLSYRVAYPRRTPALLVRVHQIEIPNKKLASYTSAHTSYYGETKGLRLTFTSRDQGWCVDQPTISPSIWRFRVRPIASFDRQANYHQPRLKTDSMHLLLALQTTSSGATTPEHTRCRDDDKDDQGW